MAWRLLPRARKTWRRLRRAPPKSSARRASARRRSSIRPASAPTKWSKRPRARRPPRPSACCPRRRTKSRAKRLGRARDWRRKWASSRWRVPRACSAARLIPRRTPNCWTSWPPRLPVAERATIARPYAKAAFDYARDAKALAQWSKGLQAAAAIVADPRVAEGTKNPKWTEAQLVGLITGVAGDDLDAGMRNFVHVLAENHRLLLLPEITEQYEALRAGLENSIDVEVVSAVTLNAAQSEKLAAALSQRFKRQVRMQASVDSSLLGGAVIRAGDLVIDGSLKGRLERLGTELEARN